MADLCLRLGSEHVDRRRLRALIASGALNALPGTMAQKFAGVDAALRQARSGQRQTVAAEEHAEMPSAIDSFDLVREIAATHCLGARDISFDVYCPKTYSHHTRFTIWLPPETVLLDLDGSALVAQARTFASALAPERSEEYVIGLNSKVDQYNDRHLLMLDLDSIDETALEKLEEFGGYLLKSGVGYHFIGRELLPSYDAWIGRLREMQSIPEFNGHLDDTHVDMSIKRGYSTLRIVESPVKPERPMMVKVL